MTDSDSSVAQFSDSQNSSPETGQQTSEPAGRQTGERTTPQRKWVPLSRIQRRVAGVLVEKAKTTPDAYPMTLNALVNGCNQKSNRDPQMNLSSDQIEESLEKLRDLGAVAEVQTSGRVPKYRHYMYEWLGVDKQEIAVMTELMLRGPQTVGELRGRAARMEQIAGIEELRPILRSLTEKGLVIALTTEGRGQIVTHGLYKEQELEDLRAKFADAEAYSAPRSAHSSTSTQAPSTPRETAPMTRHTEAEVVSKDAFLQLREEFKQLQDEVFRLQEQVRQLLQ